MTTKPVEKALPDLKLRRAYQTRRNRHEKLKSTNAVGQSMKTSDAIVSPAVFPQKQFVTVLPLKLGKNLTPVVSLQSKDSRRKKTLVFQISHEYIPRALADKLIPALYLKYGAENSIYYDVLDLEFSRYGKHRYALAILLLSFHLNLKPHRTLEGYQALSGKRLRRLFRGDDEFIQLIRAGSFFENEHDCYSREAGICKGARLFQRDGVLSGDDELIARVIADE